jgi:hypothetical protein
MAPKYELAKLGSTMLVPPYGHDVPPPEKNDPPTHPEPLFRLKALPIDDAPVIVIPVGALTQASMAYPVDVDPAGSPETSKLGPHLNEKSDELRETTKGPFGPGLHQAALGVMCTVN